MKRAIFPGTFDPFTVGNYSVVKRALTFMDEIIISIGVNESKRTHFPIEKRLDMIKKLYADNPRVKVKAYEGLTVDFALAHKAQVIIRGIRTVRDFETEETIAENNRKPSGIETNPLLKEPEQTSGSSPNGREMLQVGKDFFSVLPEGIEI